MKGKAAFVSDFDGTITGDDFFAYASEAFFDEKSLTPWRHIPGFRSNHTLPLLSWEGGVQRLRLPDAASCSRSGKASQIGRAHV